MCLYIYIYIYIYIYTHTYTYSSSVTIGSSSTGNSDYNFPLFSGIWGGTLNTHRSFATTVHNSKCVIFQERLWKFLKCYNFLWVQRRHNCSPAASFANYLMTLYLLKVHLQTFLSIPITQKCQILSCDALVANERYVMK